LRTDRRGCPVYRVVWNGVWLGLISTRGGRRQSLRETLNKIKDIRILDEKRVLFFLPFTLMEEKDPFVCDEKTIKKSCRMGFNDSVTRSTQLLVWRIFRSLREGEKQKAEGGSLGGGAWTGDWGLGMWRMIENWERRETGVSITRWFFL
jgi:hypothetical protein